MPRPKVLPEHRQRAAGACAYCRTSKRKCTGIEPCTHCVRRGIGDQCQVTRKSSHPPPSGAASTLTHGAANGVAAGLSPPAQQQQQQHSASSPSQNWKSTNTLPPSPAHSSSINGQDFNRPPHSHGAHVPGNTNAAGSGGGAAGDDDDDDAITTQARMLLNLRGERVYIGGAASISFLQFIRDVVSKQMGPSPFTHNEKTDSMLETESAGSNSDSLVSAVVDLDVQTKLSYSETYHAAVSGLLDVFSPSEVEGLLLASNDCGAPRISPCKRATIILIVAIGAQCQSSPETTQHVARVYFRQAQQHAFAGMLEDPNVDMVRAFLLMAFYMLGACRRNSAFMYLGVATRAAVALGLHRLDSYTDMTSLKSQLRSKIWMSVCILDLLVSSILGRAPATATLRSDFNDKLDAPLQAYDDEDTRRLVSTYKILSIVNEAVDRLYENKDVSTSAIESYLGRIRQWRHEAVVPLSDHLDRDKGGGKQRLHAIGAMHLSCVYYFAVTLVTRPVLVSTLTRAATAAGSTAPRSKQTTSVASQQQKQHGQLDSICIDAAVHLVQSCVDTQRAGMLLGNLCIIKALVFAAGLILGFSMITDEERQHHYHNASSSSLTSLRQPSPTSSTFHDAKHILSLLAVQSPQAGHYLEILTLLGATMEEERAKSKTGGNARDGKKQRRGVGSHDMENRVGAYKVEEMRPTDEVKDVPADGRIFIPKRGDMTRTGQEDGDLIMTGATAQGGGGLMGYEEPGQINSLLGHNGSGEQVGMDGVGGPELFFGWDTLDLSNWDSFPH